jgi:hypothetical protein
VARRKACTLSNLLRRAGRKTEQFVKRFMDVERKVPSAFQVGNYSAVRNYLKAVQAVNSTDSKTVIEQMRKTPVRDVLTMDGYLRPDGRMVHSVALMQIKAPAESKSEWDLSRVVASLKGEDVFRPLGEEVQRQQLKLATSAKRCRHAFCNRRFTRLLLASFKRSMLQVWRCGRLHVRAGPLPTDD